MAVLGVVVCGRLILDGAGEGEGEVETGTGDIDMGGPVAGEGEHRQEGKEEPERRAALPRSRYRGEVHWKRIAA